MSSCLKGWAEGHQSDLRDSAGIFGQKRKAKVCVPLLLKEKGEMATRGVEMAEALNKFFASVFPGSQTAHVSHVPESVGRVGGTECLPQ